MADADFNSDAVEGRSIRLTDLVFGADPDEADFEAAARADTLAEFIATIFGNPPILLSTPQRQALRNAIGLARVPATERVAATSETVRAFAPVDVREIAHNQAVRVLPANGIGVATDRLYFGDDAAFDEEIYVCIQDTILTADDRPEEGGELGDLFSQGVQPVPAAYGSAGALDHPATGHRQGPPDPVGVQRGHLVDGARGPGQRCDGGRVDRRAGRNDGRALGFARTPDRLSQHHPARRGGCRRRHAPDRDAGCRYGDDPEPEHRPRHLLPRARIERGVEVDRRYRRRRRHLRIAGLRRSRFPDR